LSSGVAVDEIDGVGPLHHLGDVRKRPHECFDLRKRDNEIRLVVCGPAPGAPQRCSGRRPSSQPSAAAAPAFLASEDASYVSGAAIVVDGALSAVTGQPNFDRLIGGE
jgi:NAD(P)-dependent dehydrogenase (short-subunit alcohol dehydrogenase family)